MTKRQKKLRCPWRVVPVSDDKNGGNVNENKFSVFSAQ